MNCMASTYNASGELVGCTEEELNAIISMQLYGVFALGSGLYMYKSFTADNWVDIAINIGWGCISAFTHAKRFTTRQVIPKICSTFSFVTDQISSHLQPDTESEVSVEDDHCYVRVVKDGTELHGYSSIFGLIQHLEEHSVDAQEEPEPQPQPELDSDDVVDVQNEVHTEGHKSVQEGVQGESTNQDGEQPNESESESSASDSSDNEEDMKEQLARIENHTMQFDFVMCQVPTMQTITSSTPQCMHVIKYDGFPRDADGLCFCDRKFVPVEHRMMEIVLQYGDSEYELDLASPDNFYVMGNKLLDPAFLKWFMRKNHSININLPENNQDDAMRNYTIKCIDHNANLHTLLPCNHLYVNETGFEVHDSGLV